jgi:hypothetical protein
VTVLEFTPPLFAWRSACRLRQRALISSDAIQEIHTIQVSQLLFFSNLPSLIAP